MPTYEYACKSCGENIEVFQSFNSRPLKNHAECGGELKKVFHARGVVFKGSGFYKTDSRTGSSSEKSGPNGEPSKTSSDKGASSKSSKSENGKSDAKKTATKESTGSSNKD